MSLMPTDEKEKEDVLNHMTARERKELVQAFRLFDKDGDGEITIDELQEVFRGLNYHFTEAQLLKMVGTVDQDGDGKIDIIEWMCMMRAKPFAGVHLEEQRRKNFEDELREAFEVFDKDGDGVITPEELSSIMKALGEDLKVKDVYLMVEEVDENGDGFIDFDEFKKLMGTDYVLFRNEDEFETSDLGIPDDGDEGDEGQEGDPTVEGPPTAA